MTVEKVNVNDDQQIARFISVKGAFIYDVRREGGGGKYTTALRTNSTTYILQTDGGGSKKLNIFVDVIHGSPHNRYKTRNPLIVVHICIFNCNGAASAPYM